MSDLEEHRTSLLRAVKTARTALLGVFFAASIANAQILEGIARCTDGAGMANTPVCVGEPVTCTATFNNIDTQDWTVTSLTVGVAHPSGIEGGSNLLTLPVTLIPGVGVDAALVFTARTEDIGTIVVASTSQAHTNSGFSGGTALNVLVDVQLCTPLAARLNKRAYRVRRYRATCTNELTKRVCQVGDAIFVAPLL